MALKVEPEFPEGCAIVFGGSGGIGGATAQMLISRGCNVVVTYRSRPDEARRLVGAAADGSTALVIDCDVVSRESVDQVLSAAAARFGRVHSVISTQGSEPGIGPFEAADPAELLRQIEIDLIGYMNIVQASLPHLRGSGGSVTAIVSPGLSRVVPGYGLGVIPKAGVAEMTRYFAAEEGANSVRLNAIGPGVIDTGMAIPLQGGAAEVVLANVVRATPLGRLGTAREVAELLAFLASTRASYVTGQVIMIDGGFSL